MSLSLDPIPQYRFKEALYVANITDDQRNELSNECMIMSKRIQLLGTYEGKNGSDENDNPFDQDTEKMTSPMWDFGWRYKDL